MNNHAKIAVVICAAAWALAALYGGYRLATGLPDRVQQARLDESSRRQSSWSPISGFAQACVSRVPSGARMVLVDVTDRPPATNLNQRTGPAAFGAPNDVDWPNQAAFSYVLYPRPVVPLGHLPPTFPLADATTPYVALWDQAGFRTANARADTEAAYQMLSSTPQTSLVCSFTDALGDRGWLFSAGAPAAALSGGGRVGSSLTASGLFLAILGLAGLWTIGALVLGAFRLIDLSRGLWAAAALPTGCLAISLEMLAFSVTGVPWSVPTVLLPWVVACAVIAWRRPAWTARLTSWRFTLAPLTRSELVAVAGLLISLAVVAGASPLALPQSDGFALYYFKAHAFFVDGTVLPYYRHAAELLFSFPAHPPLVPLSITWLYLFIGGVEERSTLLLWPALYSSLLSVLYVLARTRLDRKHSLWFVLGGGFVAWGLLGEAVGSGFTDLPLALFLLLGAGCLWLWTQSSRRAWILPAVSGVFLGGAILTKEEGLLGTAAVVAALPVLTWVRGQVRWRLLLLGFAVGAIAVAVASIWMVMRVMYRLPILTVDLGARFEYTVHRLLPAIAGVGLRAAPQLVLAGILVAAVVAARWRRHLGGHLMERGFQFLLIVTMAVLGGDALAIAMAPVEIGNQVQIAGSRLVSQVMPLFLLALVEPWQLLVAAAVASQLKEEKNSAEHIYANSRRLRAGSPDRPAVRAGRSSP